MPRIGAPSGVTNIQADGNCLFRAIAMVLTDDEDKHLDIRARLVDHMPKISAQLEMYLPEGVSGVDEYIRRTRMTESGIWGTVVEIYTAVHLYRTDINVYSKPGNEFEWSRHRPEELGVEKDVHGKSIYLRLFGNHFDVVQDWAAKENEQDRDSTKYSFGKIIGCGGCADVYACAQNDALVIKAVKVGPKPTRDIQSNIKALQNELTVFKMLNHERIIQYLESYSTETHFCLVLEKMPKGSLRNQLDQDGAFVENLVRKYTGQTLDGLEYLHECGIMHRDLKCANILLHKSGDIKICDFGLAKLVEATTKVVTVDAKSKVGTPYWAAPEVVKGRGHGRRCDIWSLGCTLVEMLTTNPPWHQLDSWAALFRIGSGEHPDYELPSTVSETLRGFLKRCFTVDPTARPAATDLKRHAFIREARDVSTGLEQRFDQAMGLERQPKSEVQSSVYTFSSPGPFLHGSDCILHHGKLYWLTQGNHKQLHAPLVRLAQEQPTDADIASLHQTAWWILPQCESSCLAGLEAAYSRRVKVLQLGFECNDDEAHSVWDRVKHGLEAQSIARLTLRLNNGCMVVSLTLGDCSSTVRSPQPRTVQDLLTHLAPCVKEMEWYSEDSHSILGPAMRALHRSTQLTGLHVYVLNPLPTECVQALAGVTSSCTRLQRWTVHQVDTSHHEDVTEVLQALEHRQLSCVNLSVNGKKETEGMLELISSPKDTVGVYMCGGVSSFVNTLRNRQPGLQQLVFYVKDVSVSDMTLLLQSIRQFVHLRALHLLCMRLSNVACQALGAALRHLPALSDLWLRVPQWSALEGIGEELNSTSQLERLTLVCDNSEQDRSSSTTGPLTTFTRGLVQLPRLQYLRLLDINSPPWSPERGSDLLHALGACPALREVELWGVLDDSLVEPLQCALRSSNTIRVLMLWGCNISESNAKLIKDVCDERSVLLGTYH